MSEPPTAHASLSATGYADGLGRRTLEFDREAGGMLERLHVRAEFGAFEAALRQRLDQLASFEDARFASARAIERGADGTLGVLSTYVAGDRLCDLLEAATSLPAHEATSPSVDAALGFLIEALTALEAFHSTTGLAHGAVAPGRITLTSTGQTVLLDTLFGQALERLQFNRRYLWTEFGLALPAAAGAARFDRVADISQASLAAMMIVLGRPFRENDYPDALPDLITEVIEIAQIRGSSRFASDLHKFLHRALPIPAQRAFASAEEAAVEVRQVAREIGVPRCRAALTAFVGDMNRVMSDARGLRLPDYEAFVEIPFATAPDIPFEEPIVVQSEAEPVEAPVPESLAQPDYEPDPVDEIVPSAPDFIEEPELVSVRHEPAVEVTLAATPVIERSAVTAAPIVQETVAVAPPIVEERVAASPIVVPPTPVEPVPAPVAAAAAVELSPIAKQSEPEESKRARRNARRHRDKLRSHAVPVSAPAPPPAPAPAPPPARPPLVPQTPAFAAVMPQPSVAPAPPPRKTAQPLRDEAPMTLPAIPIAPVAPIRIEPPAAPQPIAPIAFKSGPTFKADPVSFKSEPAAPVFRSEPATLTFKSDPQGFSAAPSRVERRERYDDPYVDRGAVERKRTFPWKLAVAALLVIGVGIGAGRKYLPNSGAAEAAPAPSTEVVAAAKAAEAAEKTGTIVLTTEPAGAHVMLDGKEMGDSPLTLENVPAGKHALTFVTASASVKRIVRVEPGKTAALDVAVFSGWIAVFSPVPLDISENGRAIGSSEQGRLMLSPGRHQLTLTNAELGYSAVKTVDIEPGEEHPVSVQPTGELSANAVPWAEVWMNDKKIGETPVARLEVPLGTHEIVFRNPQFPERRVTVTVNASNPVTASVDFSK